MLSCTSHRGSYSTAAPVDHARMILAISRTPSVRAAGPGCRMIGDLISCSAPSRTAGIAPQPGRAATFSGRNFLPPGESRGASRLERDSRRARRRFARDQVAEHPAAGTCGIDRWRARDRADHPRVVDRRCGGIRPVMRRAGQRRVRLSVGSSSPASSRHGCVRRRRRPTTAMPTDRPGSPSGSGPV